MSTLNVVIGAGPLGRAVADELRSRGYVVRMISRTGRSDVPGGVEVVAADVTDPGSRAAFDGASVVYHCAHPPYTEWVQRFPALQRGIIERAASCGARLVFGDNLYMYGPVQVPMTEELPYGATGPNGRVRADMASMVLAAHREGRIRATIGRASDFFGPHVLSSHVGERVFGAALRGKPSGMLGNPEMPHTFTYIKDFARGLVTLGERDEALGQAWHIPSGPTMRTREFVERVYREAGTAPVIRAAPRPIISLMALFNPMMRALKEQLYQFERPFVVDHSRFGKTFGDTSTPHDVAIRETLAWFRERGR